MFRLVLSIVIILSALVPTMACDGRLIEGPGVIGAPICVPREPERIVVLDPTFSLGMSLELDLPVVGAPLFGMSDAVLKQEALTRSVVDLGAFTEPSIEKIIALKPDLIIGSGLAGESVQAMMSRIAPTVLIEIENWKDYYAKIAEVTGRQTQATRALATFEERVARLREEIPDKTVSIIRITSWDFQVYLDAPDAYGPFAILRELGVERTPYETSEGGQTLKRPDWEDMAALDGDILLYIVGGSNNSATSGRHEEVVNHPLWQMLPAVAAGRVHRVDAATWMEFSGIASANRVLDDVERYITSEP